jgi:protein SCO1/2
MGHIANRDEEIAMGKYLVLPRQAAKGVLLGVSLIVVAAVAAARFVPMPPANGQARAPLAALEQTYIPIAGSSPISAESFVRADGSAFPARGLEGRWTLVFFGFTSCLDVCPTTLQSLSAVARDLSSGVAQGSTQIVFVSTDPKHDTPARMRAYLESFDARIVGLQGGDEALRRFSEAAGAGYGGGDGDHSTAIFVLDPSARPAGVLLRSSEPARVVADLAKLKRASATKVARAD